MKTVLTLAVGIALVALGSVSTSSIWNRLTGRVAATQTITICKKTLPTGGTNFPFTWANGFGSLPSFNLNDNQCVTKDVTHQDHYNKFTENVPAGWSLANITCSYGTSVVKIIGANNNPGFQPGDNTVTIDLNEPNVNCVFTNQKSCTPRPSGMVSWWPGDGNANDIVGGMGGALNGTATYAPGMVAQAFSFTNNGYVEVPDNQAHIPQGSFTIDAWVRPHSKAPRQSVVSKFECGGVCLPGVSNSMYTLLLASGNASAVVRDTDAGVPNGLTLMGPFVADGYWHHLAMVREMATKQLLLYVDGVLVASATLNAGSDGVLKNEDFLPDSLYIGAKKKSGPLFQLGGPNTMEDFFEGMIDEVEYFNRGLAANEIALIYQAGSSGKCKN